MRLGVRVGYCFGLPAYLSILHQNPTLFLLQLLWLGCPAATPFMFWEDLFQELDRSLSSISVHLVSSTESWWLVCSFC